MSINRLFKNKIQPNLSTILISSTNDENTTIMKSPVLFALLISSTPICSAIEMDDLFDMSLDQLTKIEITGSTLTSENMRTVPSAVTLFTHEQIK
ncbi:hypothetical protein MNBD_GAMMA08-1460, partial [hydrothermal vent metagenome]